MPDFLARIVLGVLEWLANRLEAGRKATDAEKDTNLLRRAGARIRERMRSSNGARP